MHACVCVCVAKPVAVELGCHASALIFSLMDSFVFKQQVPFRVDFLSVTLDHRVYYIVILRWPVGFRRSGRNEGCDLRFVRAMSPKLGQ